MADNSYFDRDLSWLSFNCRVLEEALRTGTPLLERIFFLSVYCSNLDEFYRVRIPAIAGPTISTSYITRRYRKQHKQRPPPISTRTSWLTCNP